MTDVLFCFGKMEQVQKFEKKEVAFAQGEQTYIAKHIGCSVQKSKVEGKVEVEA